MVGGLPVMISTWVTLVCDDDSKITSQSQSHLHAGLAAQVPLGHGHGEHIGAGHQCAGWQHMSDTSSESSRGPFTNDVATLNNQR